ncbi:hypothetical protein [Methanobacterium sp. CWC-01]|uniref:hypothetical protein n=1 Tax=Methanobacterium aridiramus TaxID=2584467 RepID=UPI0025781EA5|nr:hypothetical protein [Methanobacterium sp. CWC-01]
MDCKPKLRFPEFSGEWEDQTLGETLKATLGGGTPSRKKTVTGMEISHGLP